MPVIATNTAADTAVYYLNVNAAQESQALSEISSGSKIVNASDDPAGLAISTRIQSDVTVLEQASTNASQAVAVLQTADGGASNISDILTQLKALASEAASGTESSSDDTYINDEFKQLASEVDSIASGTRYDDESLLDGTSAFASGVSVMVGSSASDTITLQLSNLSASALGISSLDVSSATDATAALSALDSAIDTVSAARAEIGAQESRFNFSANDLSTSTEDLQSANSAITDVDVASEESTLSSAEVKTQAAVAAAAQANKIPQYLLNLLES